MVQKADFIPMKAEDITDVHFDTSIEPEQKTDAENKLDALTQALRDDPEGFVSIHSEGLGPSKYVTRIPADKFDVAELQSFLKDNYGGGDYRIRVYSGGKLTANKLISIAHTLNNPDNANASASAPSGEVSQILGTILKTITDQNERMLTVMQANNGSRTEMLNEMMLMKQLFDNGNSAPQNGLSQISETVNVLQSLGIEVGQKDNEDSGFSDLLEKAAPLFLGANGQQPQQPQQPQQYKPNPQERATKPMMNPMIKMGLKMILKNAKANKDPAIVAETLVDLAGEERVKAFLLRPDSAENILKVCPEIGNHTAWVDEMAEHVKAIVGMPSSVSDLYADENDDITPVNTTDDGQPGDNDNSDIST